MPYYQRRQGQGPQIVPSNIQSGDVEGKLDLDTSAAEQKVKVLGDHLKMLTEAQNKAFNMQGAERQLSRINQEMAAVYARNKNMASDSSVYLSNLSKQVELQRQAAQYAKIATQNEGTYSAHSDRQFAMLQQLAGQVPGGGILSRFLGGARSSALAAEAAGGSGSMFSGGALAGGAMTAGIAAAAAGVALVGSKMSEMASRAQELAESASSATSSLGQLRSQMEKTQIGKDMNAVSGGVTIAGVKQWAEQTGDSFLGGIINSLPFVGKSPEQKQKDVNAAISGGLGGDDRVQWNRLKERGQDLQIDLARQKQSLDLTQFRQNRDMALEEKSWNIDVANQRQDLNKQIFRAEQDYQIQRALFDDDHQGKMAAKSFELQKQQAQQSFQLQRQQAQENFQLSLQYKAQDYSIQQGRAQTQYNLSRSDRSYDFGVSQARNAEEFGIAQSRNLTARENQLQDMALGGATGLQYFQAARDFNLQQQYAKEDFARSKRIQTEDYNRSNFVDQRNFNLSQGYAQEDYLRGVGRDVQQFQQSQRQAGQSFNLSQQQAQAQRNLQLEDYAYQRKVQEMQLELNHSRTVEDGTIALQRFNQQVSLQAEAMGNRKGDLKIDQALAQRDFSIDAYRAVRDYGYQQQDLAGQFRKSNPLGAYGQSLTDPVFADALSRNASATGQRSLQDQINESRNQFDWGDAFGRGASLLLGWGTPGSLFGQSNGLKGINGQGQNITFSPQTNITMPTVPGVSQQDLNYWNGQVNQAIQDAVKGVYDNMRRMYGG